MLKSEIKKIIKQAKQIPDYEGKIAFLHNRFQDNICYILGCGPSVLDANKDRLVKEMENNLCFSIKLIYFSFGDLVDFHFFNCNNYKQYPYNSKTFHISQSDFCSEETAQMNVWGSQIYDLNVQVPRQSKSQTLTNTRNFESWTFEKSGVLRPWGPGIMYESVLFFAYHLGCKEIRTIGWDYKNPNDKRPIQHFYEEKYRTSKLKNPAAQPYDGEILETINLASDWRSFLNKSGRDIKVFDSDKCYIHRNLERYKI